MRFVKWITRHSAIAVMVLVTAQLAAYLPPADTTPVHAQSAPVPHSLTLDGTSAAEAAASPDLDLTSDWTVELWFKDEDPSTSFNHPPRYLINKGDGVAPESPFYIMLGSGNLLAGLRTGGIYHPLTYNLNLAGYSPKIWQHVAMTFQASTRVLTLFMDGVQVASQNLGVSSTSNTLPLQIGRPGSGRRQVLAGQDRRRAAVEPRPLGVGHPERLPERAQRTAARSGRQLEVRRGRWQPIPGQRQRTRRHAGRDRWLVERCAALAQAGHTDAHPHRHEHSNQHEHPNRDADGHGHRESDAD